MHCNRVEFACDWPETFFAAAAHRRVIGVTQVLSTAANCHVIAHWFPKRNGVSAMPHLPILLWPHVSHYMHLRLPQGRTQASSSCRKLLLYFDNAAVDREQKPRDTLAVQQPHDSHLLVVSHGWSPRQIQGLQHLPQAQDCREHYPSSSLRSKRSLNRL